MNLRKGFISNKVVDCGKDGNNDLNYLFVQYGIQADIKDEWKNIIEKETKEDFKNSIDELLDKMQSNSEQNGFFDSEQEIHTESLSGFRLDDRDLYYMFFINLKSWSENAKLAGKENVDGAIIFRAIKDTITNYLGNANENARTIRQRLTNVEFTNDENGNDVFIYPSIRKQKRMGSGICTERAAISHNLWLLTGRESCFITSNDCKITTSDTQYSNDGHSFNIVNLGNRFRLCDFAMEKFNDLAGDPIYAIKTGQPLIFDGEIYTEASSCKDMRSN